MTMIDNREGFGVTLADSGECADDGSLMMLLGGVGGAGGRGGGGGNGLWVRSNCATDPTVLTKT